MKLLLFVFVHLWVSAKIEGRCANKLSAQEQTCAKPLNLDATSVLDFYQTNSISTIFSEYLDCVWLQWNYINKSGEILYENIKASKSLPWRISRICEDVGQLIVKAEEEFKQSVIYCEKNPPVVATPLSVMRCIAKNYKPVPVEDYLNNSQ